MKINLVEMKFNLAQMILVQFGSKDSVSRELEAEMFHCLNPQKPHMCDKEDRMRTFSTFGMIRKVQRRMN